MATVLICNCTAYSPDMLDQHALQASRVVFRSVAQSLGPDLIVTREGRSMAVMDATQLQPGQSTLSNLLERKVPKRVLIRVSSRFKCRT
jgi:hypothetical protein